VHFDQASVKNINIAVENAELAKMPLIGFQDRRIRPLCHPSNAAEKTYTSPHRVWQGAG
jgi:muconolactone delta-isomerase